MCISSALLTRVNTDVDTALCDFAMPGHKRFACNALKSAIVKKFEDRSFEADKAAIEKFLLVNELVGQYKVPTFTWDDPDASLHHALKTLLWKSLSGTRRIYPYEVLDSLRVGPGASVGVAGGSLFEKLTAGGLTSTDQRLTQLWFAANHRFGYIQDCENKRMSVSGPCVVVDGSTLTCVPKTREISRTIATEPLVNMMFQQGLKSVLESRLKRFSGIDLVNQQEKNQRLAQLGSLTGQFSTIDLSSASDMLSLPMVRHYFPKEVVQWLEFTRSPVTHLPNGDVIGLNMISSMGNAFTFPLQTILFTAVVLVVYRELEIPVIYPRGQVIGNFGVNGDDIIVDTKAFPTVVRLLGQLGFIVNTSKTFDTGNFRESCGGDYYNGNPVRGVYASKLDTVQDIYSLINRLNSWSMLHEVSLQNTVSYLLSLIRSSSLRRLYIPLDEADTAGIKLPSWFCDPKLVLNRDTNSVGFLYKKFVARPTRLVLPTVSKCSSILGQILYGGATSELKSSGEVVTITVRPKGPVKYDFCSIVVPRWDHEEMTSRVSSRKYSTGVPRKWIYAVLNLREG